MIDYLRTFSIKNITYRKHINYIKKVQSGLKIDANQVHLAKV